MALGGGGDIPYLIGCLVRNDFLFVKLWKVRGCKFHLHMSRSNPADASVFPAGWNFAVKISPLNKKHQ